MARRIPVINGTLLVLLALLGLLVALAWWRGGQAMVEQGLSGGGTLLASYALIVAVSFLAAGFAEVLVPTEWVRATLGDDSGLRGLAIASAAGALTPAGPFVSMPIAAAMVRSGDGLLAPVGCIADARARQLVQQDLGDGAAREARDLIVARACGHPTRQRHRPSRAFCRRYRASP